MGDGPFKEWENKILTGQILDSAAKNWLGEQVIDGVYSARSIAALYGLGKSTLDKYGLVYKKGLLVHPNGGNVKEQLIISEVKRLKGILKPKSGTKINTTRDRTFQKEVKQSIRVSNNAYGKAGTAKKPTPHQIKVIKKQVSARTTNNAQMITNSREREESAPRNFFVEACINEVYAKDCCPHNRINLDATQYGLNKDNILVKVVTHIVRSLETHNSRRGVHG